MLIAGLLLALCGSVFAASPSPDSMEMFRVSGPLTPLVEYGLERNKDGLLLVVAAEGFKPGAADVSLRVGISGDHTLILDNSDAQRLPAGNDHAAKLVFQIPAARLVDHPQSWEKLRLAFNVEWAGSEIGKPRLRQRFRHTDSGAVHAGLSSEPLRWQPLDLKAWERQIEDRRREIAIPFTQPLDGKATLVIDDASGKRIRNLVSGEFMEKGVHRILWDGMDDNGALQMPGAYSWRAISHPGIKPVYEMSFANAKGSNHGTFSAAGTNGELVVLGTQVSEGGYQVVVLKNDGTFVRGFNGPQGAGQSRIMVAMDDKFVYAAYDGHGFEPGAGKINKNWRAFRQITLVRFEIGTGKTIPFPGKKRLPELLDYEVAAASSGDRPDPLALRGMVLLKGKLYIADSVNSQVLALDPATAEVDKTFAFDKVAALAAGGSELFAVTFDNRLMALNPQTGSQRKIADVKGKPAGLALDAEGNFYMSDQESAVIRVLDPTGKEVRTIGKAGGVVPGPYDPSRFYNPEGITVVKGSLWVTEKHRREPKRYAAFDAKTGKLQREFFGPTAYGAPGSGFDPQDETRWIGQRTLFKLDYGNKTSVPVAILGGKGGRRHSFWHQDGRTFVISPDGITAIEELTSDGTLKPLAWISTAFWFFLENKSNLPKAFIEAFERDYPEVKFDEREPGTLEKALGIDKGIGMLWVDKNGDATMQTGEIEFATAARILGGSSWGHDFYDLTLRLPGMVDGRNVLVTLKPDGWWPGGAPKYPPLNDAIKASVPIELPAEPRVSAVDRFGNMIVNSTPLTAFSPEGKLLWTYPNQWQGVHGSHSAPLPRPGELQGALFFDGMAPLDDQADVFVINGNHGRAFVITSDGLYLDEMFPDVRTMNNPLAGGIGILGGECFGGTFGRSEKTGNYYFQGGGIEYRIYRVDGLKETIRQHGSLTVSAEQCAAAERNFVRKEIAHSKEKNARAARMESPPKVDGNDEDWEGVEPIVWQKSKESAVQARIGFDDTNLYLLYKVRDGSPWVNQGTDWQTLFKTGDGVDLQLGTDETAKPNRSGPVPGDLRFFVAPSAEGDVAVLYRHRVPGADRDAGVLFQSPWRGEKVDVVARLDTARIAVVRRDAEYAVEIAVPLKELGIANLDGKALRGDFGVIYGDGQGTVNLFRNYWSNQVTGLVNDIPGEIMLTPNLWGAIQFGEK